MKTYMKFFVYVLKSGNEIFYVGKGSGARHLKHFSIAKKKDRNWNSNRKLYNKISSLWLEGKEVVAEKIFESEVEEDCLEFEIATIVKFGKENLCNLTDGGEGTSGHKLSDATRKKISEAKIGKKRTFTEEWRKNLSESLKGKSGTWKGKKLSEETKEKMSLAKKGKKRSPRSEEVRKRISESMKNRGEQNRG